MRITCTCCGCEKDEQAYYTNARKKNGRASACRECTKARTKRWSQMNREKVNAAKRRYLQEPSHKAAHAACVRRWNAKNRVKLNLLHREYVRANPERKLARTAVQRQVRLGRIPKATTLQCECGSPAAHYHHHRGYAKAFRLDVVPICVPCHAKIHRT